ncbi:MAG: hypothetical protein ACRET6_03640 [Burkholderiales bacterium]
MKISTQSRKGAKIFDMKIMLFFAASRLRVEGLPRFNMQGNEL